MNFKWSRKQFLVQTVLSKIGSKIPWPQERRLQKNILVLKIEDYKIQKSVNYILNMLNVIRNKINDNHTDGSTIVPSFAQFFKKI